MRTFLIVLLVLMSLALPVHTRADTTYPTNGWQTSTPEAQGMDSEKLAGLWTMLLSGKQGIDMITPTPGTTTFIHSALVIRHGNVVLDASAFPFTNDKPHELYSSTKSILSILVGIAIDQKLIKNTDVSIWDFFPQKETANMDAQKATITLRHLLNHTSGLNIGSPTLTGVWDSGEETYLQYLLDSPMETKPGSTYKYQDGNADLVSALLQKATGMTAYDFAQKNLFKPLGIKNVDWATDPEGTNWGGWGLALSGYDFAKIGYLMLHNGQWDGQQIVSSDWVRASINDQLEPLQPHFWEGYSNYWYDGPIGYWFNEPEGKDAKPRAYGAFGWGMQILVVVPELDLIVVTTGDLRTAILFSGLPDFILPSVLSDKALPDNPSAFAKLQEVTMKTAKPVSLGTPAMPAMAKTVSGKTYTLTSNNLWWKSLTMKFGSQDASLVVSVGDSYFEIPVGLDGVYRVSSVGMPHDFAFWSRNGIPLATKGAWTSDVAFTMEMWDVMGSQGFIITIPFDTLNITAVPILFAESAMTMKGTLQ